MDKTPPAAPPALEPEDFYFEGPNLVFTAAYHLKRGFCCGSGCRHCPYGEEETRNFRIGSSPVFEENDKSGY